MILINLLPHREARRRQRKQAFFVGLGVAAGLGLLAAGAWYTAIEQMTAAQRSRNDYLRSETAKLESQIKDIANLRTEIDGLKARQGAVEDLQLNRNVPVHLLDELVRQVPEGIYLTGLRQVDDIVTVTGMAQTNERVSEMLRNVQNNSHWLSAAELVEIKAVNLAVNQAGNAGGAAAAGREQRRLFEFGMRVSVKVPGSAASAPAGGASAPMRSKAA